MLPIELGSAEGFSKVHSIVDTVPDPYTGAWKIIPVELDVVWPLGHVFYGLS